MKKGRLVADLRRVADPSVSISIDLPFLCSPSLVQVRVECNVRPRRLRFLRWGDGEGGGGLGDGGGGEGGGGEDGGGGDGEGGGG